MKRIYLSHPYGGKPENVARALRWMAHLGRQCPDDAIVASWILGATLDLYVGREAAALDACCAEIETCEALVVCGVPSLRDCTPGMRRELGHALARGIAVEYHLTLEPV